MIANFSFAKWSLIDYHRLINLGILADRRVELINGYIVETFPKTPLNIYYREELAHFLRQNRLFWFLCGNGVYTDSFFSKIVLKVFPSKHFMIL